MSPSCVYFNKIKCFVYHKMCTVHVLYFRISGVDIILSEKQPKTFFSREIILKKREINKYLTI